MELARLIREMTGSSSEIVSIPPRDEDPKRRSANLELAGKLLSWKPERDIREGLTHTIAWFRERMH